MKSTGIVRRIDRLGRVVLPMELRKTLGWETKDPLEVYVETMERIARLLQSYGKKVIFATTTPVAPGSPTNRDEVIRQFNEAIVPRLAARGIAINDLYSLVAADVERYICDDGIHLSAEGIDLCGNAVVRAIREAEAGC